MPTPALRFFIASIAVCVGVVATHSAHAQQVQFSRLDHATVRVFAIQSIGTEVVHGANGATYQLAIPEAGHGSGVIVHPDGLVLTAEHVVHNARRVAVKLTGSDQALPATVVHADVENDFAFLVIDGTYEQHVPFPAVSPQLAVRQRVDAIGYPLDADRETPQSSQGIVSGMTDDHRLQLSIAVNPGNSGGPLVNDREELIGVVVARGDVERGVQGIAVAVPMDTIRPTYKKLIARRGPLSEARAKVAALPASETVAAAVLTRLVQIGSVRGVMDEVDKQLSDGTAGQLAAELETALQNGGGRDAEVLAMAAAYRWNAAIWMREKQRGDTASTLASVRELCQTAVQLEPAIQQRSAFVALVVSNRDPWQLPANTTLQPMAGTAGNDGRGGGQVINNQGIPTVAIVPQVGMLFPLSLINVGAALDLHFARAAHVHLEYLVGAGDGITHEIAAYGGYAIGAWTEKRNVPFFLRAHIDLNAARIIHEYEESSVDVEYALILEAGISGITQHFVTCNAACMAGSGEFGDASPFTGQLGAGVRYIRMFSAKRSDNTHADAYLVAFAHAFVVPFGLPSGEYSYPGVFEGGSGQHKPTAIGGEIGTTFDGGFGLTTMSAAYLPALSTFTFRLSFGFDVRI